MVWFNTRLLDVVYLGPLQMYIGVQLAPYTKHATFFFMVGMFNILFNGHNYLWLERQTFQHPRIPIQFLSAHGKTQIHRIYNIVIMYPYFFWMIQHYGHHLTQTIRNLAYLNIVIGTIWNLFNFMMYT